MRLQSNNAEAIQGTEQVKLERGKEMFDWNLEIINHLPQAPSTFQNLPYKPCNFSS